MAYLPGVVGAIALAVGVGLYFSASDEASQLMAHEVRPADVSTVVEHGRAKQYTGVGLIVGGAIALAASLTWVVVNRALDTSVAVTLLPGGAAVVYSHALP